MAAPARYCTFTFAIEGEAVGREPRDHCTGNSQRMALTRKWAGRGQEQAEGGKGLTHSWVATTTERRGGRIGRGPGAWRGRCILSAAPAAPAAHGGGRIRTTHPGPTGAACGLARQPGVFLVPPGAKRLGRGTQGGRYLAGGVLKGVGT